MLLGGQLKFSSKQVIEALIFLCSILAFFSLVMFGILIGKTDRKSLFFDVKWTDVISSFGSVVAGIAAIIASIVALRAIPIFQKQWRFEMMHKKVDDLLERLNLYGDFAFELSQANITNSEYYLTDKPIDNLVDTSDLNKALSNTKREILGIQFYIKGKNLLSIEDYAKLRSLWESVEQSCLKMIRASHHESSEEISHIRRATYNADVDFTNAIVAFENFLVTR